MQRFITLDSAVGISSCDLCSDQNTQIIDGLLGHSQNCEKLKVLNNYLRYLGFFLQENGNSRVWSGEPLQWLWELNVIPKSRWDTLC